MLLYKTWGYYNKFDCMKSLGYVTKTPQCGYMEHGLEYIMFYVQKHMASLTVCSGLLPVGDRLLGALAFVRFAYWTLFKIKSLYLPIHTGNVLLEFGFDVQAQVRVWKLIIQYGCKVAILKVTLLKINRLFSIYTRSLLLNFENISLQRLCHSVCQKRVRN